VPKEGPYAVMIPLKMPKVTEVVERYPGNLFGGFTEERAPYFDREEQRGCRVLVTFSTEATVDSEAAWTKHFCRAPPACLRYKAASVIHASIRFRFNSVRCKRGG
jgi:hypothetical protein